MKNLKGFVSLPVLTLGIVIVALCAGYWAWTHEQAPTITYYDISDLGIKFILPPSLSDLTYHYIKLHNDQALNSIEFSSKRLEAAGCGVEDAPLGYLTYDSDKGGEVVAHARSSNLYYIQPSGTCKADASLQDWHALKGALGTLVTDYVPD